MIQPDIPLRHEAMRIGGRKVISKDVVDVHYPYTAQVIGTVPSATVEHVAQAFEIAAGYTPTLTRYERQQILFRTTVGKRGDGCRRAGKMVLGPSYRVGDAAVAFDDLEGRGQIDRFGPLGF